MRSLARILALLATLGGCASSPPSQFYTLSAAVAPGTASVAQAEYGIVVGPAAVPESVDRPQLVLRLSDNRVRIVEQARWAEPLASAIPQVIAVELAGLLSSSRVMAYPQNPEGFDYQVLLEVLRFDSVLDDAATLEVAWTLRPSHGGEPAFGRALVRERVESTGYEALVAAHSRALRAVSAQIAATIRSNPTTHKAATDI